jgi:hypothetical protein
METMRFAFLGWPDGYEEVFLPLWYFFDQRWIADSLLGRLLVRE